MTDIEISYGNVVKCRVICDRDVAYNLSDHFTFTVPGYQFTPAYKSKRWDGKIRLFNLQTKTIYAGLIPQIKKFAKLYDYDISIDPRYKQTSNISPESLFTFVNSLNIHSKGKKLNIRPYQYLGIYECLKNYRRIIESPTSSGKSLMIYSIIRYLQKQEKKILLIVPTTSLVEQMHSDFDDYSSETDWNVNDHSQRIYGGKEKNFSKPIIISTWQSVYKYDTSFFRMFDAVIIDECHKAESKSITSILEKCTNATYRFGFTGTLKDSKCHKLVLQGLLGKKKVIIETKDLMDRGEISKLSIQCILLKYASDERKRCARIKYQEEIDFITKHKERTEFIANLALDQSSNVLILFNKIEHGKTILNTINSINPTRTLYYVDGSTPTEERESIRKKMEKEKNAILIASYGTFSTGVSIKNIHHIIFASPTKSKIRTLQSIGRGLRLHHSKEKVVLFDIADDLSWKKYENYTLKHYGERVLLYNRQKFDYRIKIFQYDGIKFTESPCRANCTGL